MSLLDISQQLTIYIGLFLLIFGVLGNSLNVLVFSSARTYRTTPCTFYFLISSIANIGFLLINLTSRVVSVGFNFDLGQTSVHWCRARQYFIGVFSLISFTCSSLASIDQYFVTSKHVHFRRLSNIEYAYRITLLIFTISCLHAIPCLIYYDISPVTKTCVLVNSAYAKYIPIYSLSLTCFGPIIVMIVFSYLAHQNIQSTRVLAEQQAGRQLRKMTLFHVVLVIVVILPYSINVIYLLKTAGDFKDTNRLINESFASTVMALLTYVYYAVSSFA
ncbi:unnamed protein product [Adineta ricciae]|uniref:G-protein coupled receptors family 1 profile domain-containing protein n=1 Tax=Adineta ricciae TaxID=249248 RepID=A0A816EQR3_ADIRI|nr:unnamed protein product [Adineta ricciae]CAF1653125.1 unnamed protein product [Adineta ricciae]